MMIDRERKAYERACIEADTFNNTHDLGTPVRYWPGVRQGEGVLSTTRSRSWALLSGHAIVAVEGYPGGIALSHVEVLEPTDPEGNK